MSGRFARMEKKYDIVLAAANAGYIHSSLALRCIMANLGALADRTILVENDTRDITPIQWCERLLLYKPHVIGFSVYIWNVSFVAATIRIIRRVAPQVAIVVGGPQMVYNDPDDTVSSLADAVIYGEGEMVAAGVFTDLLNGKRNIGAVHGGEPDISKIVLPYHLYSAEDVRRRLTYVESSRGCPFRCAYCTSADSGGIRFFPEKDFLAALDNLMLRGARHIKFLDRSFNRGGKQALAVLDFLLQKPLDGITIHFEFTPEMPSDEWRERLIRFPPHALHIEVGIQTWQPEVAKRVYRFLNRAEVDATLLFLIQEARADVHADLIAGLPGETVASFKEGFDHLVSLNPAEIQVGILKSLPGTAIRREAAANEMRFSPDPPYEVLATADMTFTELQEMSRFARCWELVYNRGRFSGSTRFLWAEGESPFDRITTLTNHIYLSHGRMHALSPARIAEALIEITRPGQRRQMRELVETDARNYATR